MATLATTADPAAGETAAFLVKTLATKSQLEVNDQLLEDRNEEGHNTLFGTGIIAGSYVEPLLSAGAGLAVAYVAHQTLLGFVVTKSSPGSIAVPDDEAVVYIFARQDGTFTANTTGANPGSASNPAVQIGTAATAGGVVTSVDNTARVEVVKPGKGVVTEWFGPTEASPSAWDADPDLRTGGTVTITLSHTPDTIQRLERSGVGLRQKVGAGRGGWTLSGSTITFEEENHPIDDGGGGEDVGVWYIPA